MTTEDHVILVDHEDREIGTMGKTEAHLSGRLHRAFSIFLFNAKGEMLIHQRQSDKYHSGGLWTNACCSHPRPGETTLDAAHRRLLEEMGMKAPLKEVFAFTYRAELDNELTEHEFDHVFVGFTNEDPRPNPEEVQDWKYVSTPDLLRDIEEQPQRYTAWFRLSAEKVIDHLKHVAS
ncbi:MAG: isopentenyl-diphosphate Delta-isomerase [Flavobacteriales bacterium]|nr:isopentenyl-diphosphate Delta-isomerase [Flavobacteriales bacterium]